MKILSVSDFAALHYYDAEERNGLWYLYVNDYLDTGEEGLTTTEAASFLFSLGSA